MHAPTSRPGIESVERFADADETWGIADHGDVAARCALWFHTPPMPNGERAGYVGGYVARDADVGARILEHACERLRRAGCAFAIGPIDGSTWRRYRLSTWSGGEPTFALEPTNPAAHVEHFERAGFTPFARYGSYYDPATDRENAEADAAGRALHAAGIVVRPFAATDPERDVRALYDFSRVAFARNFLQTPIGYEEFAAIYRPALALVDPAYVLLAEHAGRLRGFVFALPDRTFDPEGTVLVGKTLARDPDPAYRGLGAHLVARVRGAGAAAGCRGYISALIHERNASRAIPTSHGARIFRRYALFAKALA
jgi:GNAT superfamily N-acetyltransferase